MKALLSDKKSVLFNDRLKRILIETDAPDRLSRRLCLNLLRLAPITCLKFNRKFRLRRLNLRLMAMMIFFAEDLSDRALNAVSEYTSTATPEKARKTRFLFSWRAEISTKFSFRVHSFRDFIV